MTQGTNAGWLLDGNARAELLERFPPLYTYAIAHHVTDKPAPPSGAPPEPATCRIVGRADDLAGVEALVVEVNGSSDRPDGGTYHITWSLGAGRKARESNDVIGARGWAPIEPVSVPVTPARFNWQDP